MLLDGEDLARDSCFPQRWALGVHQPRVRNHPLPVERAVPDPGRRWGRTGLTTERPSEPVRASPRQGRLDPREVGVPALLEQPGLLGRVGLANQGDPATIEDGARRRVDPGAVGFHAGSDPREEVAGRRIVVPGGLGGWGQGRRPVDAYLAPSVVLEAERRQRSEFVGLAPADRAIPDGCGYVRVGVGPSNEQPYRQWLAYAGEDPRRHVRCLSLGGQVDDPAFA